MEEEDEVTIKNQKIEPPIRVGNDKDDYDPHHHRNVPKATTNYQTLVHLLKGTLGTGIMAMPEAFKNSGYVNGVISVILITFVSTYCFSMLVKNQYILCKRHRLPVLSYPMSMKMALDEGPTYLRCLSKIAIYFVDTFLIIYQSGICCVYVVFVAKNFGGLIDSAFGIEWKLQAYIGILLLPFMLLLCVRNLKLLAPFSLFSNVITFVGVICIFYYYFKDGIANPSERKAFNSPELYPLFLGTVLFATNGVPVVVVVENNMKTPKSFNWVISVAMAIICVLYTVFGFIGYFRYGDEVKGSVTLNVDQTEVLAKIIRGIFALATFISYALQGYVPLSILWGTYLRKRWENSEHEIYYEFAVRILFVLITSAIGAALSFIGLAISLVGALCIPVLGFICPALMEICVLYNDELSKQNLVKNILLILFGIFGLIIGTYTSVLSIVTEIQAS